MLTSWVGTQCHRHVSLERRVVSTASSSVACQRNEGNAASSTRVRMFRTYRTYRTYRLYRMYRMYRMYGNKSPGPETQSNRSSGIGATENVQCVMCTCVRRGLYPIGYTLMAELGLDCHLESGWSLAKDPSWTTTRTYTRTYTYIQYVRHRLAPRYARGLRRVRTKTSGVFRGIPGNPYICRISHIFGAL